MMEIITLTGKNFKAIINITAKSIRQEKIVVFPTDTIYGLLADVANRKAVEKLFKVKKRPLKKPIPIFVKDLKQAKELAKIDRKQEKFLRKTWPGKVTAVLKSKVKNQKSKVYGVDKKTIALRIPKHKLVQELLKKIDKPLTGTSANLSGKPASTKIKEILKQLKNQKYQPDLVIDSGNLPKSKPSTVIDLTKFPYKILRK